MELEKKFRTEPDSATGLLRIIALKDFSDVKKGDRGGLIQKEPNLSQNGDCWVYNNARVYGNARVLNNAVISDNARVYKNAQIFENACVSGNAKVTENAYISGDAKIFGNAQVYDYARVYGRAKIYEDACVVGDTWIKGNAEIFGKASVSENAQVFGNAKVSGYIEVCKYAKISGNVRLWSSMYAPIDTSIKNNKDFTMFIATTKTRTAYIFPSTFEDTEDFIPTAEENYINNLQIIRQLHGEKI